MTKLTLMARSIQQQRHRNQPSGAPEFAKVIDAIIKLAAVIEDRPAPIINVTLQQPKVLRTVTAERRADGKLVATIVASPDRSN